MSVAIHWFRADLRLRDNTALHQACAENEVVYPIFILDPEILLAGSNGGPITAFFFAALESLRDRLWGYGVRLTIRYGAPREVIPWFIRETGAKALYYNKDVEPYAMARDQEVEGVAKSLGVRVYGCEDSSIIPPGEVMKPDGGAYTVFTPYCRSWMSRKVSPVLGLPRLVGHKGERALSLSSDAIPKLSALNLHLSIAIPEASEEAAQLRLDRFIAERVGRYRSERDFPALDGTSQLSPYIRAGLISARTVYHAARGALEKASGRGVGEEIQTFIKELVWRDFYRQILFHFPRVATGAFRAEYNEIAWENRSDFFEAWCEGRTGFPIVDAGMRQLNMTGWMHNRLRMIVAMFLTKDLHISWQWGERYFMQRLLDADLASNNGGWQWSASTGTDAAPYFRIFNPNLQAARYDPKGVFIARFVPERNDVSYRPIVDHEERRLGAMRLYRVVT